MIKGSKHSSETIEKMKLVQKSGDLNVSKRPDVRTKISLALKGKKKSEEHTKKIRLAQLGKKLTPEQRIKRSLMSNNKGSNCHLWRGGITALNKQIRQSIEYKLWRTAVFERDNYTCVWCSARCGNGKKIILNADHIKPFAYYPELRFAIDNGRTLCVDCHRTTDTFGHNVNLKTNQPKP